MLIALQKLIYFSVIKSVTLKEKNKNMNKKIWYSISLIIIVASSASIGTYSYFTADRTTSANKFVAGTLDLNVSANGNKLEPFVVENIGNNPTISGSKVWTVKNTGTLPGRLLINLQNLSNLENGCNDQEKLADPSCEEANKSGNLGKVIILKMSLDGQEKTSSTLDNENFTKTGTDWGKLSPIILQPGEEKEVSAYWAANPGSYGNEIQSDSVQFDISFRLVQSLNNEPVN